MNNNINNQNNNMNNQYNSAGDFQNNNEFNNSNINNSVNQVEIPNKKNNTKLLAIIIGVIVIIVIVIVVALKEFFVFGSNKNTTGSTEYKDSDVDYNCTYEYANEDTKMKVYLDFIFNYKSNREDGNQNNYQLAIYDKMIVEYENGLTDEEYKEFIDSLESLECFSYGGENKCTESHLELGITSLGWDTIVDRTGDKIEVTYNNVYGLGRTATEEDIRETKEQYASNGYVCE